MSRHKFILMAPTLLVAGCNMNDAKDKLLAASDPFSFSQYVDKFSSNSVSEAVYNKVGDPDDSVEMRITLKCEVPKNEDADPFDHTKIEFLLYDLKGKSVKLNKFSVKFDSANPESDLLETINSSEYNNERIYHYAYMGAVMIPDQVKRTFAMAEMQNPFSGFVVNLFSGQRNNKEDMYYEAVNLISSAKFMMIRYTGHDVTP